MAEGRTRTGRWWLFRAPESAGAIYGTIAAMAVIAGTAKSSEHGEALGLTIATLLVFWLAHVYAHALAHHLQGARRLDWSVVRAAMAEEWSLLQGPVPLLVLTWASSGSWRSVRPSGWPCGWAWSSWSPGASCTPAASAGAGSRP